MGTNSQKRIWRLLLFVLAHKWVIILFFLSVAFFIALIGSMNEGSPTNEYVRMVEKGTLRTFGRDVVPVSAFFSGFWSMLIYFLWK